MKTKWLKVKAGKNIHSKLTQTGLNLEDIKIWAGAAGGPKWIILFELDKYLTKNYFNLATNPITHIGGSIGAWRATCYSLDQPTKAIERLGYEYINQSYDSYPTTDEVSQKIKQIIYNSIGDEGIKQILNPKNKYLNILSSKVNFKTLGQSDLKLKYNFGKLALAYLVHRKTINHFAERTIFSNSDESILKEDGIKTRVIKLDNQNIAKALISTGSIPLKMNPVIIDEAEYWDGGLVDYHLDMNYKLKDEIVFYPHFFSEIKPGWFDKFNRYRKSQYHHNTLLLYPSQEFIKRLPNQKLTDLKDFTTYMDDTKKRIKVWNQAAEMGKHLVDDFVQLLRPEVMRENLVLF